MTDESGDDGASPEGQPPDLERLNLESEALGVLAGAEETRERIAALVNFHFRRSAFDIKSRVKAHRSIVHKVLERRAASCAAVLDIVGFRIIDLYRVSVPQTFKRFWQMIHREPDVFVGVPVVKVYEPTTPHPDYKRELDAVFGELGINVSNIARKESAYSSIHLLVTSRAPGDDPNLLVPVEFQFRSAIEDVWSEMEHKIKYKGQAADNTEDTQRKFREYILRQLGEQKTFLDLVEVQLGGIFRTHESLQRPASPFFEKRNESVVVDEIALSLRKAGLDLVAEQYNKAIELRDEGIRERHKGGEKLDQALQKLDESSAQFALTLDSFQTAQNRTRLPPERIAFLETILTMERAFNDYQTATTLRVLKREDDATSRFKHARKTYIALTNRPVKYVMIEYRLAQVYYALGDYLHAITFLEKVQSAIDQDESIKLRPKHWLRAEFPRFFGLVEWSKADLERQFAKSVGDSVGGEAGYKIAERIGAYSRALDLTIQSFGMTVEGKDERDEARETHAHQIKCANNILSYLWEIFKLGGLAEAMSRNGLTTKDILNYLALIEAGNPAEIASLENLERADSALVSYRDLLPSLGAGSFREEIGAAARQVLFLVAREFRIHPYREKIKDLPEALDLLQNVRKQELDERQQEMVDQADKSLKNETHNDGKDNGQDKQHT